MIIPTVDFTLPVARRALSMLFELSNCNCADYSYLVAHYGGDAVWYAERAGHIKSDLFENWFTYETTETGHAYVWRVTKRLRAIRNR